MTTTSPAPAPGVRIPLRFALMCGALLCVASCVTTPVPRQGEPMEVPPEVPAVSNADRDPSPIPAVTDPPVIVLMDDPDGSHRQVLQVFSAQLGRPYEILNLAHRSTAAVVGRLTDSVPVDVVVLGTTAYQVAKSVEGLRVVSAAVFGMDGADEGVDALPPFDVQLDYWRRLNPDLERLGVIGSERMEARMEALTAECARRGLLLERRTVASDRETLIAFRGMVPRIDGFVFLPDESVLSPEVIRQIIVHGRRNDVQTLVYSPLMFNLGATIYVQPDPVGIAQSIVSLLRDGSSVPVRGMLARNRLDGMLVLSQVEPDAATRAARIGY